MLADRAGDAWAVVGGSQDLIGVSERMSSVRLVAPASGCLLYADLWAVPAGARGGSRGVGPSPLLPSWLEFGLSPARSVQHSGLKSGAVPHALPAPASAHGLRTGKPLAQVGGDGNVDGCDATVPWDTHEHGVPPEQAITHDNGFMPGPQVLQHSEFLVPVDDGTLDLYRAALLQARPGAQA
eukprot:358951-Chlamydomonas_euryale.AAC.2